MLRKAPTAAGTALAAGLLALGTLPALAGERAAPDPVSDRTAPAATADRGTEGQHDPAVPPGMLKALTRDLHLTPAQARNRLASERSAAPLAARLRSKLGPHYGGAWVSGPTSRLTVATTDSSDVPQITAAGARAKVVRHSLAQLQHAKSALDRSARRPSSTAPAVWAVDVRHNRVLVGARQIDSAKDFVAGSGAGPGMVQLTHAAQGPRTYAEIVGGDPFYAGQVRCSVGFSVTKGGRAGYLTAGHCGQRGLATQGPDKTAQGTFQGSSFPGNDYAWVQANPDWTASGQVNGSDGTRVTVAGSQEALEGSSVCRSGSTSGWHCGTIQERGTSVRYDQGTVYGVTKTSVCAEPGDSGGPFISGDQAQGTTSGGTGDCTEGGTTYFQPVNEPLRAYGLTLATGQGQGGGGFS